MKNLLGVVIVPPQSFICLLVGPLSEKELLTKIRNLHFDCFIMGPKLITWKYGNIGGMEPWTLDVTCVGLVIARKRERELYHQPSFCRS